jgi:hypothetical protein
MLNSHVSAPLNPLLSVADLQALLSQDSSEVVVFDASAPPVVPGYESLNSHVPEADWRIIPGRTPLRFRHASLRSRRRPSAYDAECVTLRKRSAQPRLKQAFTCCVYDDVGVYASPRGWWMLKAMGMTMSPCWTAASGHGLTPAIQPRWEVRSGARVKGFGRRLSSG